MEGFCSLHDVHFFSECVFCFVFLLFLIPTRLLECALAYVPALKLWARPFLKKIKLMQSVVHAAFN